MRDLKCEQIELDEFEAMRLCDVDNLEQAQAGEKMGVSRGTIQRLLETGRRKLIQGILEKKALKIGELPSCCGEGKRCES